MNKVTIFEEFRLIERCETEVNSAWRGAHLLLFFLAFVFGSFCTFCFHMLMYLFDEKCVLFPKLLSLTSTRHNVIYEFIPNNKETQDLPVDFLSTQWVEKNACTLPTYVPLLSGIFGLVWTTMFLMCSTGSRTLTGLQRPWRVLPPVFVFSLAMGSLCVYSSAVTHYGLQELCYKLGEITGSSTCTYTVNVATLAYERRIRGVYQATRLTILTAWLHTACWLLSALLALARVLLAVDFQLVRINVDLRGDIDKMLQRHEQQIRTVSPDPDFWINDENVSIGSLSSTRVHFKRQNRALDIDDELAKPRKQSSDIFFFSTVGDKPSELSLVPAERIKLARQTAYKNVPKDKYFIVDIIYDILDSISVAEMLYKSNSAAQSSSSSLSESESESAIIIRQIGQEIISSKTSKKPSPESTMSPDEAEELATDIKRMLQRKLNKQLITKFDSTNSPVPPSTPKADLITFKSSMDITDELRLLLELVKPQEVETFEEEKSIKKSNLKSIGIQTDKPKGKVQISLSATNFSDESDTSETNRYYDKKYGSDETADEKPVEGEYVTGNVDKALIEKLDGDEIIDTRKIVEKDVVKVVLKVQDPNIIEVPNIDPSADPKTDIVSEIAKKELSNKEINDETNVDSTVVNKVDFSEPVVEGEIADEQVDNGKDKEIVNDNAVSKESRGEASVNVDDETDDIEEVGEHGSNKQTQTKPKEKQD